MLTKGTQGKIYSLSECHKDVVAYEKLTDSVFEKILDSECHQAIAILKRILKRDFYRSIATIRLSNGDKLLKRSNEDIAQDVRACVAGSHLNPEDIFVLRRSVTQGMGSTNPIEKV